MKKNSSSGGARKTCVRSSHSQTTIMECCMCGDYGFSYELFRCKLCHFRSQHRYCSNEYPKAESYKLCNWCLALKNESSNSNSSSSSKTNNRDEHDVNKITPKEQKGLLRLQFEQTPMSPEIILSPPRSKKKNRAATLEERIRRTRSEELTYANSGIGRHVSNKVRRYKLLADVSS